MSCRPTVQIGQSDFVLTGWYQFKEKVEAESAPPAGLHSEVAARQGIARRRGCGGQRGISLHYSFAERFATAGRSVG